MKNKNSVGFDGNVPVTQLDAECSRMDMEKTKTISYYHEATFSD